MPAAGRPEAGVPLVAPQPTAPPLAENRSQAVPPGAIRLVVTWWSDSQMAVSPSRVMFAGGLFVPMKLPCTAIVAMVNAWVEVCSTENVALLTFSVNRKVPGANPDRL